MHVLVLKLSDLTTCTVQNTIMKWRVFTARYAMSPYIKGTRCVCKELTVYFAIFYTVKDSNTSVQSTYRIIALLLE